MSCKFLKTFPVIRDAHQSVTLAASEDDGNDGIQQWPAPRDQLDEARQFLQKTAQEQTFTVRSTIRSACAPLHDVHLRFLQQIIIPDKDADGLSGALIVQRTLETLGMPSEKMHVHFLKKGTSVHSESER